MDPARAPGPESGLVGAGSARVRGYWRWALITGGVAAVFHVIPFTASFGCCCTPSALLAGFAAGALARGDFKERMSAGESAYVGLLSGVVCGVLGGVIGAIKSLLSSSIRAALCIGGACGEGHHPWVEGTVGALATFGIVLFTSPLLGALGGLIAAALPPAVETPPGRPSAQ